MKNKGRRTNLTVIAKIAAATSKEIGAGFKADIFTKALGRAERRAKAAYGGGRADNLENMVAESGYSIAGYYQDVLTSTTNKTFNRAAFADGNAAIREAR